MMFMITDSLCSTMKQLIQNQTVSFDTHQAGDGQPVNIDSLHIHKRMNNKTFNVHKLVSFNM